MTEQREPEVEPSLEGLMCCTVAFTLNGVEDTRGVCAGVRQDETQKRREAKLPGTLSPTPSIR